MRQQKLSDYSPKYPKKVIRGAALAATALLVLGTAAGCRHPEPQIMGDIAVDDPTSGIEETLPPEELRTEGLIPVEEMPTEKPEEITLMGDVMVPDEQP